MAIWKIHSTVREAPGSAYNHLNGYAAQLKTDTDGNFEGSTDWSLDERYLGAVYRLSLVIPTLSHYTHHLFRVVTDSLDADYPLTIEYRAKQNKPQTFRCEDEASFVTKMEELIQSEETAALLSLYLHHLTHRKATGQPL